MLQLEVFGCLEYLNLLCKKYLFGVTLLIRLKPYLFGITSLVRINRTHSEISLFIAKNHLCLVETTDFNLETKVYYCNATNYIGVLIIFL